MDLKALGKDLNSLQTRLEKYEDLVQAGVSGPQDVQKHNLETLAYYRTEATKVRTKYLEMMSLVKTEIEKE